MDKDYSVYTSEGARKPLNSLWLCFTCPDSAHGRSTEFFSQLSALDLLLSCRDRQGN